MLDIQNMSDEDKLHNSISSMQGWAQNELRRQNVKDLPGAIAAADSLVDFWTTRPSTDVPSTSKLRKRMRRKENGERIFVKTIQMIQERHK